MNMYFVHEYSNEQFETYDECRDDLLECLDERDIMRELDLSLEEVIYYFYRLPNNQIFIEWLSDKTMEARERAIEDLITYYEEEETE